VKRAPRIHHPTRRIATPEGSAFDRRTYSGTVDKLLKPESKPAFSGVVPVRLTAQELMETVKEGGGMTRLKTCRVKRSW
jgi:hypothetical protein